MYWKKMILLIYWTLDVRNQFTEHNEFYCTIEFQKLSELNFTLKNILYSYVAFSA